MGWLWYLVMLLPVVGIIQVGGQAHADRYTYLPQIGIYVAVTWLVAEWRVSRVASWGPHGRRARRVDGLRLETDRVLEKQRNLVDPHARLHHRQRRRPPQPRTMLFCKKGKMDEAIAHYQKALQIKPDYADPTTTSATLFGKGKSGRGDHPIPKGTANQARLRGSPLQPRQRSSPKGKNGRSNHPVPKSTANQARLRASPHTTSAPLFCKGQSGRSRHLSKGRCKSIPTTPESLSILASLLRKRDRTDEAIAQYQKALQIKPDDPGAKIIWRVLLATLSARRRCATANKAVGTGPATGRMQALTGGENPIILHTLAAAFAEAGRFSEAVETAQRALRLAGAQSNTGWPGNFKLR